MSDGQGTLPATVAQALSAAAKQMINDGMGAAGVDTEKNVGR